ncbi:MAG: cyclic nucleotide-binding domain-containing protein [Spirochaetia bacterium]|jgi:CRP-like cAMP-binding protein|nr:cyclic nucleotide-binding domain-containing protein [Spirochaetia bacterium]
MNNPLQLSLVNFKKGAYVIVEGKQVATKFFIIRTGKVLISREFEVVEEQDGNILGPGDFFGVISTMSGHSHIENAQALTDVSLISVQKDQYGLLIEKNTQIALKIVQSFSRKMRYLDEALTRITLKSIADERPDHLFKVAEYYARQSMYNHAFFAYYQYIRYCPAGENLNTAKERMAKIKPYANALYLEEKAEDITRTYPKDTMIFSESQPGQELYIIQKGSVKITKIVNDNEILIAILKAGDIFGEMSLLENKPRSASAIAYEDSVLMAVNKANFQRMVGQQPQMITRLTQLLAERIWLMYRQLENTQLTNPVGRLYDALYIQLEKARVSISPKTPYTFNLGPKELLEMVGLTKSDSNALITELFSNKKIKLIDNKIFTADTDEISKQANYFRKMEKIEQARRKSSMLSVY